MAVTSIVLLALGADACPAALCAWQESGLLVSLHAADTSGITDALSGNWSRIWPWVQDSYRYAPALILGLAALLAIPPLALLGLLLRRRRRPAVELLEPQVEMTDATENRTRSSSADGLTWPVDAWIEIDGKPASRIPIVREILRIGREDDNDLVVATDTVHRYHAVIHRTEDADVVIIDTSGPEGNGVMVNASRTLRQRLKHGDRIDLGTARLKFSARKVGALQE